MDIKGVINLIRVKYQNKVDISNWDFQILSAKYLFRADYQNNFVMIRELIDADYFDITFLKAIESTRKFLMIT